MRVHILNKARKTTSTLLIDELLRDTRAVDYARRASTLGGITMNRRWNMNYDSRVTVTVSSY